MKMPPAMASILGELAQVGRAPVVVRVDPRLFPPDLVRRCAARCGVDVSLDHQGAITVAPGGSRAREVLRRLTQDLLTAVLERE